MSVVAVSGAVVGGGSSPVGAAVSAGADVSGVLMEEAAVVVGGKEVSVLAQAPARSTRVDSARRWVDQVGCLIGSKFSEGVDA